MPHAYLISQIIGVCAMVCAIISYQLKTQRAIFFTLCGASFLWAMSYLVLGNAAGCAINLLSIVRSVIYSFHEKKWVRSPVTMIVWEVIFIIATVLTWENIFTVLPLISAVITGYCMWQENTAKLKILTVPSSACWLIYNIRFRQTVGAVNECMVLASIAVYFIRTHKKEKIQ